jgi:hypothetical protein
MFRRRIEDGANCSPFVSQAMLPIVKEVFGLNPDEADHQLGLGQIRLLVVEASEPAGKPLEECQKVTVRLTLDDAQDGRVSSKPTSAGVLALRRPHRVCGDLPQPRVGLARVGGSLKVFPGGFLLAPVEQEPADEEFGVAAGSGGHVA